MTKEEWIMAAQLSKILKATKDATLAFSRSTPNTTKVIPAMDKIDEFLATDATESRYLPAIKAALAVVARLLNQYYGYVGVHQTATILHPSYRLGYLEKADWPKDSIVGAITIVKEEFKRTYADFDMVGTPLASQPGDAQKSQNMFNDLSDLIEATPLSVSDELMACLEENREKITDIIGRWNKKRRVYPQLAQMALNYYNIPASSVDVERAFLQGRILLSRIRNRLSAESTRSLLCFGAWFKSGLVSSKDFVAASKLPESDEGGKLKSHGIFIGVG